MLTTQADRFTPEEVRAPFLDVLKYDFVFFPCFHPKTWFFPSSCSQMEQMFTAFPPDVAGNLDYKNLVYVITHGEEKDQE